MKINNKLNTFGGVFVPSILTILGVIMYMRLPWIIGQSGLYATLGIILVAHIISITTGLSISSIATDKKVEAGGTYYMISRSLGLPIGGTLGLALFVGLSFSVSLYLIGFSEAFLSFFGMDTSINSIRITGLIVLSSVTFITFLSTKLAIKTQYLILSIMLLSLLSIFFGSHQHTPSTPNLLGGGEVLPWIVLFGIFFPAVTGFEAGVSMSGDLQNPKKAIPMGTILAISIGLVVYVVLTIFFSYTVSADELRNNPNVLFDIARVKYLVVAGIFGATLSSALGSILAAPRILQAISIDKITPKLFAKGYGGLNEPRNALVLTFFIALSGIMIGDLNAIARIVTIFFIITYGFLNLSCFVESWASSDFRPSFKIHPIISIIGAIACFVVMIQLDFLAMIMAIVLLSGIFFYLKRKELVLKTGDAWNSVWSSIVKSGLIRLKNNQIKTRNWRPNIILFSGGIKTRPYLVEIGTELIGKLGILTDFELIETANKDNLITKIENNEDSIDSELENNIFRKKIYCSNIYHGIESISQLYGFSGVEPNTVLLGLPSEQNKLSDFLKIYGLFEKINYNSILIRYNKELGFGKKKNIHLWWDGESNNLFFAISLLRFLTSGFKWRHSKCRLNFINQGNMPNESIYKNLKNILADYRIDLEIKIFNNVIENKNTFDIIKTESANTDLIIYELSKLDKEKQLNEINLFINNSDTPTLMLLNASNHFEKTPLFIRKTKAEVEAYKAISNKVKKLDLIELPKTNNIIVYERIKDSKEKIEKILFNFYEDLFVKIHEQNLHIFNEFEKAINSSFKNILKDTEVNDKELRKRNFYKIWSDMLYKTKTLSSLLINEHLVLDKEYTETAIENLLKDIDVFIQTIPQEIKLSFSKEDYTININDNFKVKLYKLHKLISFKAGINANIETVAYKKAFEKVLKPQILLNSYNLLIKHQENSYKSLNELRKIIEQFKNTFYRIELSINENIENKEFLTQLKQEIIDGIAQNKNTLEIGVGLYKRNIFHALYNDVKKMALNMDKVAFAYYLSNNKTNNKRLNELNRSLINYPDIWLHNTQNFAQQIHINLLLQSLASRIKTKIHKSYNELFYNIKNINCSLFDNINNKISNYIHQIENNKELDYDLDNIFFSELQLNEMFDEFYELLKSLTSDIPEHTSVIEQGYNERAQKNEFSSINVVSLPIKKNVEFILDNIFPEKMNTVISQLNNDLNKKFQKINNLISLSRYNIDNIFVNENLNEEDEKKNKIKYLNELSNSIVLEKNAFINTLSKFSTILSLTLKETFEPITLSYLYSANDGKTHTLKTKKLKAYKKINPFLFLKHRSQEVIELLLYGRSKGILFAKHIQVEKNENRSALFRMLLFAEENMPKAEIINKLPFYYKNLFNNKFTVNNRFWVGRENELKKASKAIEQHRNGSSGGIMILGERNSGKTSLSNLIAQKHYPKEKIFQLQPLRQGSCNIDDFISSLSKTTNIQGGINDIMHQLPHDCTIIINDMALWWERSENGMAVIKTIMDLINTYSNKCLFIINSNTRSYSFINKLFPLNNYFLAIIKCEPFSTYELRNLILKRHQSSEVRFKLGKLPESLMIEWRYAKLFNSYFNYSDGVIGTALNAWLTNIKSIKDKEIVTQKPKKADISSFDILDSNTLLVLAQLILHRRLNFERLQRIMKIDDVELNKILHFLSASQLVNKLSKDIYLVNSFLEPHIVKYLINKEII